MTMRMMMSPRPSTFGGLVGFVLLGVGCDALSADKVRYRTSDYARYSGSERFLYGEGASGARACALVWASSGKALSVPSTCVGCEFVFAVSLVYDGGPYAGQSTHDGTCADLAVDGSYTYAYSADYGAVLLGYGEDYYVEWLPATFDTEAKTFTYGGGVVDMELSAYGYPGVYYTYAWSGEAVLQ